MTRVVHCAGIILASKSPRRRRLLEKTGLKFKIIPSRVDESSVPLSDPDLYVKSLAEAKAKDISGRYPDHWVVGADTIVYVDHTILGKPASGDEARVMLKRLRAKTHQVHTGYCICHKAQRRYISDCVTTDVSFRDLSAREIDWYIDSGEAFGKAGAYAIQGIGSFLVKRIEGSYTSVVGLPVCEVLEHLIKEGAVVLN
jgi:septum formation protein